MRLDFFLWSARNPGFEIPLRFPCCLGVIQPSDSRISNAPRSVSRPICNLAARVLSPGRRSWNSPPSIISLMIVAAWVGRSWR